MFGERGRALGKTRWLLRIACGHSPERPRQQGWRRLVVCGPSCGLLGCAPLEAQRAARRGFQVSAALGHRSRVLVLPAVVAGEPLSSLPPALRLAAIQDIPLLVSSLLSLQSGHRSWGLGHWPGQRHTCWCTCSVVSVALGEHTCPGGPNFQAACPRPHHGPVGRLSPPWPLRQALPPWPRGQAILDHWLGKHGHAS